MKPLIGVLATAAVLGPACALAQAPQPPAPPAAVESRLAGPFRTLCMAANGKADATAAAARAAGYVTTPAAMLQDLSSAMPGATHPAVLWKAYEGGLTLAITGEMPAPGGAPMTAEVCGIASIPSEPNPAATLAAILGVGGPLKQEASDMFVYDESLDGRRAAIDLRDAGELHKLLDEGRLRMAMAATTTSRDFDISVVMLLVPRPRNSASVGPPPTQLASWTK
jgi:hypothetical protein